jgi:hypothetical protein
MQKFTQKYTLIQLFEAMPEGAQFEWTHWPLHTTLVDVFAIEWNVPMMVEKLATMLATHTQATSVAGADEFFGPEKQTQVVLLKKTDGLVKLHYDLVTLLEEGGLKPNNPQFTREGFLPHSTVQKQARLNKGDEVTFNAVTIIDMFPNEDPYQRRVLKTIKIGK